MGKLIIRTLNQNDVPQMYMAFSEAFQDYSQPLAFSMTSFSNKFIEKLSIDFSLSCGAFYGERLVGFIFHSIGKYSDKLTAYNGGTGVIPSFRQNHITKSLYEFLIPIFKKRKISQCVLEVLTNNHKALGAYKSIGFKKSNFFRCYKLVRIAKTGIINLPNVEIENSNNIDWNRVGQIDEVDTSFLDSVFLLEKNIENENIALAKMNDKVVGYIIFQSTGRISRFAVEKIYRHNGIGAALFEFVIKACTRKDLTVMNVKKEAEIVHEFLLSLGFENQLNQFELTLPINMSS